MKDIITLAVESSCDETSVAVLKNGREVISNIINTQVDLHKKFGGVVPEVASRKHIENIDVVLQEALDKANIALNDIDHIAVTYGPGLVGALLVGLSHAKALAFTLNKPLVGVNHIEGHVSANYIEHKDLKPPFITLIVSGGHTHLVEVKDYGEYEILGRTRDDASGEAFDKIARAMGLGYPGGPIVDRLAKEGNKNAIDFPRAYLDEGYDFSFSGLKSAVINLNHKAMQRNEEINQEDLAASFQDVVLSVLVNKTIRATKEYGIKQVLMAGGVSANRGLRNAMGEAVGQLDGVELLLPPMSCCTDNAMMIALAAKQMYDLKLFSDLSLGIKPNLDLENESVSGGNQNG